MSNILLFLICLFCEMRKMFQVSLLHKFQRKMLKHFKFKSAWKIAKDWANLRWVIMICSCEKAQSQGISFQFSRFTWIWNEYFAQISCHLVLRNNAFVCEPLSVLAKSEETSMYYTICKETGIQRLTRSLYIKSNNCVELYESMERIKALFFL